MIAPKQSSPEPWPSGDGWTIAILAEDPERLGARFGLEFEHATDDLDAYQIAAFADRTVGQLWLFRRVNAPVDGTEVIVDLGVSRDDGLAALDRALGDLPICVAWRNPAQSA